MLAAPGGPGWRQSLLWLIQPADSGPAAITAAALLLAGLLAYATGDELLTSFSTARRVTSSGG